MKPTSKYALALAMGILFAAGPMGAPVLAQEISAQVQAQIDAAVLACETESAEECAAALDSLFASLPDEVAGVVAQAVVNRLAASASANNAVVAQAIVYVANTQLPAGPARDAAIAQAVSKDPDVNTSTTAPPSTTIPEPSGVDNGPGSPT